MIFVIIFMRWEGIIITILTSSTKNHVWLRLSYLHCDGIEITLGGLTLCLKIALTFLIFFFRMQNSRFPYLLETQVWKSSCDLAQNIAVISRGIFLEF